MASTGRAGMVHHHKFRYLRISRSPRLDLRQNHGQNSDRGVQGNRLERAHRTRRRSIAAWEIPQTAFATLHLLKVAPHSHIRCFSPRPRATHRAPQCLGTTADIQRVRASSDVGSKRPRTGPLHLVLYGRIPRVDLRNTGTATHWTSSTRVRYDQNVEATPAVAAWVDEQQYWYCYLHGVLL